MISKFENKINVLSLFDGMSCGRIALEKLGIKVNNYFSCEIDKYALKVANDNFPMDEVNRLGDVTKVKFSDLPKIDLVIGGSPCQGFSFAGKQLAFDDTRSKLFFEFVRAIKETNPTYFMLENVRMKKEFQDIISEYMGVEPICINSALVSAQNRVRYYWTNIPGIEQPEDREIYLKDVLEDWQEMKIGRMVGRKINPETGKRDDYNPDLKAEQRIEPRLDDKSGTLTTVTKDNLVIVDSKFYVSEIQLKRLDIKDISPGGVKGCFQNKLINTEKSECLMARDYKGIPGKQNFTMAFDKKHNLRKLTPIEYERLQTVPDNYTKAVSNSQRYKMLGNGWTVDVIAHIFQNMVI